MRRARRRSGARAVLLALSLGACGPYSELAQKLDVTARIAGDTWIAAGPDRAGEIRILLVGKAGEDGVAPFAFTTIASDCMTLQGTWTETGAAGDVTLRIAHTYTMPKSSGTGTAGSQRDDTPYAIHATVSRSDDRLVLAGDARLVGTYVGLKGALARLGTSTPRDATCAFQLANLSVQSSEIRILGFGGGGMTQYLNPATFIGTIAGSVTVRMSGISSPVQVRIAYSGFEDQGGVVLNGEQDTSTSWSGSGSMYGVLGFTFSPLSLDPTAATTPITGTIDYGNVTLGGGVTSGGSYALTIDGGASADVPATGTLSPTVAECLSLP